jgi:hypothetical protein
MLTYSIKDKRAGGKENDIEIERCRHVAYTEKRSNIIVRDLIHKQKRPNKQVKRPNTQAKETEQVYLRRLSITAKETYVHKRRNLIYT